MSIHEWLAEWLSWGWSLTINHLWQATLFSGLALAVVTLMKRGPARARYAVWLIAFLKFAVPSILIFVLAGRLGIDFSALLETAADQASEAVVVSEFAIIDLPVRANEIADEATGHNELYCGLTLVWLIGCAVVAGVWCKKRFEFSLALRAGESTACGREWDALERVRGWLAIRRRVQLVISPRIPEPGAWRTFRPVIVLPDRMADYLSEAELEAVLMHEMVHIARWDNLVSNFQMMLCCLFWFHPLIWLIDRRVLAERERACDDRVIEIGGVSKVYALSLLKVLRFCLGTKMAGVSYATGSNLRRRVERIMNNNVDRRLKMSHRMLIMATAVVVIAFSIATGLLSGDGAIAQAGQAAGSEAKTGSQHATGAMVRGGVVKVPAELASSDKDAQKVEDIAARVEQAPETIISFKNLENAPMTITDARVKAAYHSQIYKKGDDSRTASREVYMFTPDVTLINNTSKRITRVQLYFVNTESKHKIYTAQATNIEPYGSYNYKGPMHYLSLPGDPGSLSIELLGVHFEDKSYWRSPSLPPPPPVILVQGGPPPPEPPEAEAPPHPPEVEIPPGPEPPEAEAPPHPPEKAIRRYGYGLQQSATRRVQPRYPPLAKAARVSGSVAVEVFIDPEGNVVSAKAIAGHSLLIDEAVRAARLWKFAPASLSGEPVQAVGTIVFDFSLSSPSVNDTKIVRKTGGVLQGAAIKRVQPKYPEAAKEARVSGTVVVEVLVDQAGVVISARAISGHVLLTDAAVEAAERWEFTPTLLAGEPVQVIGTITFVFSL